MGSKTCSFLSKGNASKQRLETAKDLSVVTIYRESVLLTVAIPVYVLMVLWYGEEVNILLNVVWI